MKGQAENHPAVDMDPSTPFKRRGPVSRLKDFIAPTDHVHVLAHLGVARVEGMLGVDERRHTRGSGGCGSTASCGGHWCFSHDEFLGFPVRPSPLR